MKTAQEWLNDWPYDADGQFIVSIEFIKQIQQDAYRAGYDDGNNQKPQKLIVSQPTTMITLAKCPKCDSLDTTRRHHNATFAIPECYCQECDECGHQWNHT